MKTAMSSISIFVPPLAAWVQGQPVDDRSRTHVTKDLTHCGPFPLSAVTSVRLPQVTFAPRIIYGQGQDNRAHISWPGPGPPGTTNKVTSRQPAADGTHSSDGDVENSTMG